MGKNRKGYSRENLVLYLDAWDLDDLPDGAWLAYLTEGAEQFAKDHHLRHYDAHEMALEYVASTSIKLT
jgi:hypothetical protein